MLKEIVEFSKQLEDAGIYALVNGGERKLDKPVMVIPVSEDMASIKLDDAYFVFKDIIDKEAIENGVTIKKPYVTLDGKNEKDISWEIKNSGKTPYKTDKKVIIAFLDDEEDKIWEDAVAEDFMKGDSERDAAYDKL
ncbi:hypothetical protein KsCSTR_13310 [Candidatus Kuenenia stuttgartiensis]|uniref:Uncharacterized protein n=1 Tax=Kuenenia stuttgartiensis TaxID=174633 RepID=A0A6G7GM65_KUEST|nr:hypothetical protein [Candidatus Kuenenia stuttgartiensis]QII10710.1 hypothetical protein KsCSTR_13310 [Candidatus Kuenenia stuttgartiensis]